MSTSEYEDDEVEKLYDTTEEILEEMERWHIQYHTRGLE
jgi:hypothetical protein